MPGYSLLLVSRSAAWVDAVRDAVSRLRDSSLTSCRGRDAIARLASATPHYSHVLVEHADADGMFNELADLTKEVARPDTDMIVLGGKENPNLNLRAVPVATAQSVLAALMAEPLPRDCRPLELAELRAALDGAQVDTRYQPIIRLADRKPVGLEALARLNHPVQGVIPPDRFMPLIEDAGLTGRLTELVCGRALADMNGVALAERDLTMSLNFSLDVLLSPHALPRLEALRQAAGIAADRIIIELTESRPVENFDALRVPLAMLRQLGYGAAIDDVGPAVPRLGPLLNLPFTSLKLDKDVVQQANTSADVRAFLRDTIQQAKAHGLTVVAEGVETKELWTAMQDLGADEAQGFLAARPLPVAAVPIWLDHWGKPD